MFLFHWSDYLVFAILLSVYGIFGIYFKVKYHKRFKSNKEVSKDYYLANRTFSLLPVTASILVSFMSAISVLGTVAEVYMSGIEYGVLSLSYFIAFPLSAFLYLPTFYRLKCGTVHEYLQLRFCKLTRTLVSLVFCVQSIFYMSVVLYAPALAFSQVSGLQLWVSILVTGLVCTFYTTLGGIRAVIWTDLVQFFIMLIGMLTVVSIGIVKNGGIAEVWSICWEGGRLKAFNFDPNPLQRHSFFSLLIGGTGMCMSLYATNQTQVQRYLTCKSERTAKRALILNIPITLLYNWMLLAAGLVVYATFAFCDPLNNKEIYKSDQIFPYMVMKLMHDYSPVPGLFLSTILAAALSTVSSGINSLSNVLMEDIWLQWFNVRGNFMLIYAPITVSLIGVSTIALAFLFSLLSSTVLQIALSLFGMLGGPIFATVSMGLFIPCVNNKGAVAGLLSSLLVNLWLGLGAIFNGGGVTSNSLARNTSGCINGSSVIPTVNVVTGNVAPGASIYSISYLYYTLIAFITCLLVAFLVSALSGFNSKNKIGSNLLNEFIPRLSHIYPKVFPVQIEDLTKETISLMENNDEHQGGLVNPIEVIDSSNSVEKQNCKL